MIFISMIPGYYIVKVVQLDVSPSQPQPWQQRGMAPPQNPTIPEATEPVELELAVAS